MYTKNKMNMNSKLAIGNGKNKFLCRPNSKCTVTIIGITYKSRVHVRDKEQFGTSSFQSDVFAFVLHAH